MKMNEDSIKGNWKEMKGDIQKMWGKLTDDDLEKTKGDLKAISGLIQQRYGEEKEKMNTKLSQIFKKFESQTDSTVDSIKKSIRGK